MAKRIDVNIYAEIVAAFRNVGVNHAAVSKMVGYSIPTIRKIYHHGVPNLKLMAIKDVLENEVEKARAFRQEAIEAQAERFAAEAELEIATTAQLEERIRAQRDAIEARAAEGESISGLRESVRKQILIVSGLMEVGLSQIREVESKLSTGELSFSFKTPWQAIKLAKDLGRATQLSGEALQMVIDMERQVMGDPAQRIDRKGDSITKEESLRMLMLSQRALRRAYRDGELTPEQAENYKAELERALETAQETEEA